MQRHSFFKNLFRINLNSQDSVHVNRSFIRLYKLSCRLIPVIYLIINWSIDDKKDNDNDDNNDADGDEDYGDNRRPPRSKNGLISSQLYSIAFQRSQPFRSEDSRYFHQRQQRYQWWWNCRHHIRRWRCRSMMIDGDAAAVGWRRQALAIVRWPVLVLTIDGDEPP